MATVTKLFRKPEDTEKAVADLKGMGCEVSVIEKGSESELDSMGLSEQELGFYKIGVSIGGKVVKTEVDDAKTDEVKKALLAIGFDELTERPAQWAGSPGFVGAVKMSATNPLDAQMSGDFRKY